MDLQITEDRSLGCRGVERLEEEKLTGRPDRVGTGDWHTIGRATRNGAGAASRDVEGCIACALWNRSIREQRICIW